MPGAESGHVDTRLTKVARVIEDHVDVDALAPSRANPQPRAPVARVTAGDGTGLSLAVAYDAAFNFYYADDFEALRREGV